MAEVMAIKTIATAYDTSNRSANLIITPMMAACLVILVDKYSKHILYTAQKKTTVMMHDAR